MTHMVFGTLLEFDAPPSSHKYQDISPSHPLSRPIPLTIHPRTASLSDMHFKYGKFRQYVRRVIDDGIRSRNVAKLAASPGSHVGGLESGSWWELNGEDEELHLSMMPFFADVFENTPTVMSDIHGNGTPAM